MEESRPAAERAAVRRPGPLLALTVVAAALIGAPILAGSLPSSVPAVGAESTDQRYIEIECGGYDADGELEQPRASQIERVPVDDDGTVEIPTVCGGYTADGTFVGDD